MKKKYKEVVINIDYGGFGLSDMAYEELIKLGVPVKKYTKELAGEKVIFDNELTPYGEDKNIDIMYWEIKGKTKFAQRYWTASWLKNDRENPLLIKVVKKLKNKASGFCASLKVVRIPINVDYVIEEYDGAEEIVEKSRRWS